MDLKYITNGKETKSGKDQEKDGAIIFIIHSEFFMKVHCSWVKLAHDLEISNSNHQIENIDNSQDEENQKSTQEKINNNKTHINDSDVNEDIFKPIFPNLLFIIGKSHHPPRRLF